MLKEQEKKNCSNINISHFLLNKKAIHKAKVYSIRKSNVRSILNLTIYT